MLTAKQIEEAKFAKERNGYSIKEVDDFMDQCAATVAALLDERSANNKKMQVLADKLVEYRNEEDSIRSVLMNAQRLSDTTIREAKQKAELTQEDAAIKAEKILNDAQKEADDILNTVQEEKKAEEAELARLKHEVAQFKDRMLSIYREHLSLINVLPEEPETEEAADQPENSEDEEDTVDIFEETQNVTEDTVDFLAEETENRDAEPVEQNAEELPEEETQFFEKADEPTSLAEIAFNAGEAEKVAASEEEKTTSKFADLKFGEDYVIADDAYDAYDTEENQGGKGLFHRKK